MVLYFSYAGRVYPDMLPEPIGERVELTEEPGRRIYSPAPTRGSSLSILKNTKNLDSSFSLMY
jgi:hypothetical protein